MCMRHLRHLLAVGLTAAIPLISVAARAQLPFDAPSAPPDEPASPAPKPATAAPARQAGPDPPSFVWSPQALGAPREERVSSRSYRWYGWHTLIAVGAWDLLMVPGLVWAPELGSVGVMAGNTLGAPIVQLVHGKYLKAAGSLALHLGLTGAGISIGLQSTAEGCTMVAAFRGDVRLCAHEGLRLTARAGAIGAGIATIIDIAAFGWERTEIAPARAPGVSPVGLVVVPSIAPGLAGLSVAGGF